MKKKHFISLIMVLFLLLCSCEGQTTPSDTTVPAADTTTSANADETSASGSETTVPASGVDLLSDNKYKLIRPEDCDNAVTDALVLINEAIAAKTGSKVGVATDWLNTKRGEVPGAYEILIGRTNRPESSTVADKLTDEYDFRIEVIGAKLVILGGCDMATYRAAVYFAEEILQSTCALEADFVYAGKCTDKDFHKPLDGETGYTLEKLYDGVTSAHISLSAESKYGQQEIFMVEFDPKQADLYFDVVGGGSYATNCRTTSSTTAAFDAADNGKTPIVAINGDLWMTTAHGRVLGSGKSYGGYSDAVVTKSLTVPRGFNMYDGEIISSAHIEQETPYEGKFYAFGITEDGTASLGCPQVTISVSDKTGTTKTISADGLNRLPANNALIVYSDRVKDNYSLSDAYEVLIDCGYDYTICHGAKITGRVAAVIKPGDTKKQIGANQILLTARGSKLSLLASFEIGDEVELSVKVTDALGNNTVWQKMKNAVGGHIPLVINGKSQNSSNSERYPTSILGIKSNGHVVMITYDGRQSGYAVGVKISDADDLCADLGVATAFLLDGGGSATMVQRDGNKYSVVNKPSDGSERSVVNSVILSFGQKKS